MPASRRQRRGGHCCLCLLDRIGRSRIHDIGDEGRWRGRGPFFRYIGFGRISGGCCRGACSAPLLEPCRAGAAPHHMQNIDRIAALDQTGITGEMGHPRIGIIGIGDLHIGEAVRGKFAVRTRLEIGNECLPLTQRPVQAHSEQRRRSCTNHDLEPVIHDDDSLPTPLASPDAGSFGRLHQSPDRRAAYRYETRGTIGALPFCGIRASDPPLRVPLRASQCRGGRSHRHSRPRRRSHRRRRVPASPCRRAQSH